MNERELSRLAVLSEALVWNPLVYPELIRNMRESGRLQAGSDLEKAVTFLEEELGQLDLDEAEDKEDALEKLKALVPKIVAGQARSPQWHLGQMLTWALETQEMKAKQPARATVRDDYLPWGPSPSCSIELTIHSHSFKFKDATLENIRPVGEPLESLVHLYKLYKDVEDHMHKMILEGATTSPFACGVDGNYSGRPLSGAVAAIKWAVESTMGVAPAGQPIHFTQPDDYSLIRGEKVDEFIFDECTEWLDSKYGEEMYQIIAALIAAQVLAWGPEVVHIDNVDPATMLALIHVESTGDEYEVSASGTYRGLLQIGPAYMKDALEWSSREQVHVDTLIGDGRRSLQVFNWYMQRYAHVHEWKPRHVALVHKAGPVGAQRILDRVGAGVGLIEAAEGSSTPGAGEFIRRFDEYREMYADALEQAGDES